jgi:outer membrane protein TolC
VFCKSRADFKWIALASIFLLALGPITVAQSPRGLTLEQSVDFALKNYPAVRASLERINAAQAGIGLARTSYLPRADMLWQINRATDNNITGLLLPQSVIAPITGAVTCRCPP